MNRTRLFATVLAVVMITSVFAPLGTVAADDNGADDGLSVDVDQDDEMLVTVTDNVTEDPIENATLNVTTVDEDATYEGAKNYTTDEDGTVDLPVPNETVEVELEASDENVSTTKEVELEAPLELSIDVDQDDEVLVTVTDNVTEDPIENATLNVTAIDEAATYDGTGTYETDEDGAVELPGPNETVEVALNATSENASAETEATLEAAEDEGLAIDVSQNDEVIVSITENATAAENASLNVTTVENVTYDGVGNYTADEDGAVALPVPNETVDVALNASYEDERVTETVTLDGHEEEDEEAVPFGHLVSQFVEENRDDTDGPFGQAVSSFVTENNPGNASGPPAHAGPPEHAGPGGDEDDDDRTGPPAHAGPGGDDAGEAEDEADTDDEDDERGPPGHDDERGPPSHAGSGGN